MGHLVCGAVLHKRRHHVQCCGLSLPVPGRKHIHESPRILAVACNRGIAHAIAHGGCKQTGGTRLPTPHGRKVLSQRAHARLYLRALRTLAKRRQLPPDLHGAEKHQLLQRHALWQRQHARLQ